MESVKSENESELTSTVGNTMSTSNKDEKNDTNDATPTSSTDASTASTASRMVSDDPISSTSSDTNEKSSSSINQISVDDADKVSSVDQVADLLEINVGNVKITEDVEDLVHDLESLLGESTDSFILPVKAVEMKPEGKASVNDPGPQYSVEVCPQLKSTKNADDADIVGLEKSVSHDIVEKISETVKKCESSSPERLELEEKTHTTTIVAEISHHQDTVVDSEEAQSEVQSTILTEISVQSSDVAQEYSVVVEQTQDDVIITEPCQATLIEDHLKAESTESKVDEVSVISDVSSVKETKSLTNEEESTKSPKNIKPDNAFGQQSESQPAGDISEQLTPKELIEEGIIQRAKKVDIEEENVQSSSIKANMEEKIVKSTSGKVDALKVEAGTSDINKVSSETTVIDVHNEISSVNRIEKGPVEVEEKLLSSEKLPDSIQSSSAEIYSEEILEATSIDPKLSEKGQELTMEIQERNLEEPSVVIQLESDIEDKTSTDDVIVEYVCEEVGNQTQMGDTEQLKVSEGIPTSEKHECSEGHEVDKYENRVNITEMKEESLVVAETIKGNVDCPTLGEENILEIQESIPELPSESLPSADSNDFSVNQVSVVSDQEEIISDMKENSLNERSDENSETNITEVGSEASESVVNEQIDEGISSQEKNMETTDKTEDIESASKISISVTQQIDDIKSQEDFTDKSVKTVTDDIHFATSGKPMQEDSHKEDVQNPFICITKGNDGEEQNRSSATGGTEKQNELDETMASMIPQLVSGSNPNDNMDSETVLDQPRKTAAAEELNEEQTIGRELTTKQGFLSEPEVDVGLAVDKKLEENPSKLVEVSVFANTLELNEMVDVKVYSKDRLSGGKEDLTIDVENKASDVAEVIEEQTSIMKQVTSLHSKDMSSREKDVLSVYVDSTAVDAIEVDSKVSNLPEVIEENTSIEEPVTFLHSRNITSDLSVHFDSAADAIEVGSKVSDVAEVIEDQTSVGEPVTSVEESVTSVEEQVTSIDEQITAIEEPVTSFLPKDILPEEKDNLSDYVESAVDAIEEDSAVSDVAKVIEEQTSVGKPVTSVEESITSIEEPVTSIDEQVTSVEEPVTSFEEPVTSVEEPATSLHSKDMSSEENDSAVGVIEKDSKVSDVTEVILKENSIEEPVTSLHTNDITLEEKVDSKVSDTAKAIEEETSVEEPLTSVEEPVVSVEEPLTSSHPKDMLSEEKDSAVDAIEIDSKVSDVTELILEQTSIEEPVTSLNSKDMSSEEEEANNLSVRVDTAIEAIQAGSKVSDVAELIVEQESVKDQVISLQKKVAKETNDLYTESTCDMNEEYMNSLKVIPSPTEREENPITSVNTIVNSIVDKEPVEMIIETKKNIATISEKYSEVGCNETVEKITEAEVAKCANDAEVTENAGLEIQNDGSITVELPVVDEEPMTNQNSPEAILASQEDIKHADTIEIVSEICDSDDKVSTVQLEGNSSLAKIDAFNKITEDVTSIEKVCHTITEGYDASNEIIPLGIPPAEMIEDYKSPAVETVQIEDLLSVETKKTTITESLKKQHKVNDLEFAPLVLSEDDSDDESVPTLVLDSDERNESSNVISNEVIEENIVDEEPLASIDEALMGKPTFEETPTSSVEIQANLETILAVAALQKIDIPTEPERESMLSDNERREMEALQRAVESITNPLESPYVEDANDSLNMPAMIDGESDIMEGAVDENMYALEQSAQKCSPTAEEHSSQYNIPANVETSDVDLSMAISESNNETVQEVENFSVSQVEVDVSNLPSAEQVQNEEDSSQYDIPANVETSDVDQSTAVSESNIETVQEVEDFSLLQDEDVPNLPSAEQVQNEGDSSRYDIPANVESSNVDISMAVSESNIETVQEVEESSVSQDKVDVPNLPSVEQVQNEEDSSQYDIPANAETSDVDISTAVSESDIETVHELKDFSVSQNEVDVPTLSDVEQVQNDKMQTILTFGETKELGRDVENQEESQSLREKCEVDPKFPDVTNSSQLLDSSDIEKSKDEDSHHSSSSKIESITAAVEEVNKVNHLENHTVEDIQEVINNIKPETLPECNTSEKSTSLIVEEEVVVEEVVTEMKEANVEKSEQLSGSKEPEQETSVDSSGIISETVEVQPAKEKDAKLKTTERPRRHKKENKLEQLSINVDVPDGEKTYSPKVSIKPIRVPDDEVSTTCGSDSDIVKGSLKITITKQSDKMHSVLKVVDSDNQDNHLTEQEEPIPKLIIKSKMQQVDPQHSPKMSTRSSKQSYSPTTSNQRSLSPRITIKPVLKPENKEPLSPLKIKIGLKPDEASKKKVSIKPILKSDDVESRVEHSPRITIKPIPKPEVELIPRLNIKPIKKQEDELEEKERSSPKITIKPIVKAQEESQSNEDEDPIKERIVLKINKGNLPAATKDGKKRDHQPEEDKSEKLAKITVKFSKEGGHPHIVQQVEEGSKRPYEEHGVQEKSKKQKVEVESIISTRSRHKEQVQAEGNDAKSKKDTENPHKHKDASHDYHVETKRAKKDDNIGRSRRSSSRTRQKDVDNSDEIQIIEPKLNSPIVISEDSRSQDSSVIILDDYKEDSASDLSLLGINPDSLKGTPVRSDSGLSVHSASSTTPSPRKRGRPRKVPVEIREEFKEHEEPPSKTKPPAEIIVAHVAQPVAQLVAQPVHESGRPKRSCVGQSVCDTLGIKPRKPRGPGRGRGGKRGMGGRAALSKETTTVSPFASIRGEYLQAESQEAIDPEGKSHSQEETELRQVDGIVGDKDLTILIDDSDDVILVVEPDVVEVKATPSTRGGKKKYKSRGKRRSLDCSNREVLASTSNLLASSPQAVSKYVQEPDISNEVSQKSEVCFERSPDRVIHPVVSTEESSKHTLINDAKCSALPDEKEESVAVSSTVDEETIKDPRIESEEVIDNNTSVAVEELLPAEEIIVPEGNNQHGDEKSVEVDSTAVVLDEITPEIEEETPHSGPSQADSNTPKVFSSLGSPVTADQGMPASILPLLEPSETTTNLDLPLVTSSTVPSEVMMVDEETRMSADTSSRAQTPAKQMLAPSEMVVEESQSSVHSTGTTESGKTPSSRPSKAPRLEVQETETDVITADLLTEYYWNGNGPFMIQEQVAQFLGIKSFKRKYPNIPRRILDMQERDFVREKGLVSENMCDLGLTSVNSADILDIMYSDFQEKYEEYCKHLRDKQAKELITKQRALSLAASQEKNKADILKQAVQSAALWNARFNKNRKDDRRACMDLQTLTVHYPKGRMKQINKPPVGNYPVAVVPGQYTDYFEDFTPTEINNLPLHTMCYENISFIPRDDSEDSGSESSDSGSGSSDSSSSGSDSDSSSGVDDCKLCKHSPSKKANIK
ncbi:unnamed protein product [Phaedon cochleariae]|uniref:PHD finger protein 10 n=1 Tax=Phaedon cochleariae TaxID=80249 RepID=A0A9P0DSD4_PHACE|nr:unnamed protein product [Phaedon cochleariae]